MGSATLLQLAFLGEKRAYFPMGKNSTGTTKCTKIQIYTKKCCVFPRSQCHRERQQNPVQPIWNVVAKCFWLSLCCCHGFCVEESCHQCKSEFLVSVSQIVFAFSVIVWNTNTAAGIGKTNELGSSTGRIVFSYFARAVYIFYYFVFVFCTLSCPNGNFSHGKFRSLSPWKASCNRVALPNPI